MSYSFNTEAGIGNNDLAGWTIIPSGKYLSRLDADGCSGMELDNGSMATRISFSVFAEFDENDQLIPFEEAKVSTLFVLFTCKNGELNVNVIAGKIMASMHAAIIGAETVEEVDSVFALTDVELDNDGNALPLSIVKGYAAKTAKMAEHSAVRLVVEKVIRGGKEVNNIKKFYASTSADTVMARSLMEGGSITPF